MKQSSIEWLVEQMNQRENQGLTLSMYELRMFAEQAKQMHKQEIVEAYDKVSMNTPEEYYKNTYEKDTCCYGTCIESNYNVCQDGCINKKHV